MANLPGIVIKIGANTKNAIDGLNRVNAALGKSQTKTDRMHSSMRALGPAMGIAAGAAGAFAVTLGVQGVQSALAEEQELVKLNRTLANLGFSGASDQVGTFIDNLQYAANVADTDLRNAFSTLLRGTRDVSEAQRALSLAVDVSAGSGRDLAAVAQALSRGYSGNTTGLSRLNAGLSKTVLKSGDMIAITKELAKVYGGQGEASANTLAGSVKGVQIAWDELVESFGQGIIGATTEDAAKLQDIEAKLRALQPQAQRSGESVRDLGISAMTFFDRLKAVNTVLDRGDWASFFEMIRAGASGNDEWFARLSTTVQNVGDQFSYVQYEAYRATNVVLDYKTAAEDTTNANDRQVASIKRLNEALSNLGKKQSIMEQRFNLNQLIAKGPAKSGQRKDADGKTVNFTTTADRKEFAFNVANDARTLASSLIEEGKRGAARNKLSEARDAIRALGLSDSFEGGLLTTLRTPSPLRAGRGTAPGTPQTGREVGMINYNFYGDLVVKDMAEAAQQAKKATRLQGLGRGQTASAMRYAGMAAAS